MKVLLSAYACRPGWGSELGVGWRWALETARRGHDVWVATRTRYRAAIEQDLATFPHRDRLNFLYYELPAWLARRFEVDRYGQLHNFLWQWRAARAMTRHHRDLGFDVVHHVSYVAVRYPSFMWRLGVPFVFGPVGGGDTAPLALRRGYSLRGWFTDMLRDLSNWFIRYDPTMRRTFRHARIIFATSPATRDVIPERYRHKVRLDYGLGIDAMGEPSPSLHAAPEDAGRLRILYIGRLACWKGVHLGIEAFAKMLKTHADARLTIVGSGPERAHLGRLADRLGLADAIEWISWVDYSELSKLYSSHDAFLFPSLHDSAPWVVLEALVHALPVICMDLGGPGIIVDDTCGRVIVTRDRSKRDVVDDIAAALRRLADDPALRRRLAQGALEKAGCNAWPKVVERVYRNIEALCE